MRKTVLVAIVAALVGAIVAVPIAVYAAHQFKDVPNSHIFHNDIDWMADNGITAGCNPSSGGDLYCPDAVVNRGQMAAFMRRLATNKVVAAATAETAVQADSATVAETANTALSIEGLTLPEVGPRAVFNSTDNAPDGTDLTLSAQITAPEPGILVMTGGIEVENTTTSDSYSCRLRIDSGTVEGSTRVAQHNGSGTNEEEDCQTSGAEVVAAGTYTVEFFVGSVDPSTVLGDASMWAMWVPFDGSGDVPSP